MKTAESETYLALVGAEASDFFLEILDLLLVLLIDCHLLDEVLLGDLVLDLLLLYSLPEGFLFLLGFGQLDLNIPQTLLKLFDLSLSDSQLVNRLLGEHLHGRLDDGDVGREIRVNLWPVSTWIAMYLLLNCQAFLFEFKFLN